MKISLAPVVSLLHGARHSTLATQSLAMPGYPYATVLPNVLDQGHRPVLLVSALAEHSKNILSDPRVSISLTEPRIDKVQEGARLTLVGDAERFDADALMRERYLRYEPEAEQYLQLDFMFFRILPRRLRYIGGVGKMGWLEASDLAALPSLSPADEAMLVELACTRVPQETQVLGVDPFGIDYLAKGSRGRAVLDPAGNVREQVLAVAPTLA